MHVTLKKTSSRNNYDSAFLNPCIDKVLEATGQVQKGLHVILVFEDTLNRFDSFQVTQSFPLNLLKLPNSVKQYKLWKKLFQLCPHLVQPVKIIYCLSKKSYTLTRLSDFFLKNQLNEKSELIKIETTSKYPFLKRPHIEGVIFQEYKINVSRLFIELLKNFEQLGGKIIVRKSFNPSEIKSIIHCHPKKISSCIIPVKVPSNLGLVYRHGPHILRFLEWHNHIQITGINKAFTNLSRHDVEHIAREFFHLGKEKIYKQDSESFLSLSTIEKLVTIIDRPLPGAVRNGTIKDHYELGLEKYDIAKQTGIDYSDFKILFHRYGSGIDEMTELAYEKMDKIRDPSKIWDMVEKEYQIRNEWKVG